MADSFIQYTADGGTDTYGIPFGYLDPDHISVSLDGVPTAFTFPTESQVQITSGNPANGVIVEIRRTTPRNVREIVWQNAANLTATDLNTADLQLFYIAQESFDSVTGNLQLASTGNYDALGNKIENLGTPTAGTDAATKDYADQNLALTAADVVAADAARTGAEQAETNAAAILAQVETIYDNFDDRYLGQFASDPTLDNDGDPITDGALYYNTTFNNMRVYDLGTTSWLIIETNIADGAVTEPKLATDSVSTDKIVDLNVTNDKIANSTIAFGKLADIASQAEAEAGTATDKLMTPERTSQAIDALVNVAGRYLGMEVFTASGTWTRPADCNAVEVIVTGGGGGGAGAQNFGGANAGTGGTSSFGAHCSATGGEGGDFLRADLIINNMVDTPRGGVGSNGDINIRGQAGFNPHYSRYYNQSSNSVYNMYGPSGSSSFWGGGERNAESNTNADTADSPGAGGGGGSNTTTSSGASSAGQGGAGGGTAIKYIDIAGGLLASETVTVGGGGSRGNASQSDGGTGAAGIVVVKMYS